MGDSVPKGRLQRVARALWGRGVDGVNSRVAVDQVEGPILLARRFLQIFALLATITASIKSIAWPWIEREFFAGPAVALNSVSAIVDENGGRLFLQLHKLRPCDPKGATVILIDKAGVTFSSQSSWTEPLPVKRDLRSVYRWEVPKDAAPGLVQSATFETWHWHCADGPDPQEPATFQIEPFVIGRGNG